MASGHSDLRIDPASDGSDWAVTHHGQRSAQIHARRETSVGMALKIGALIGEPYSCNGVSFNQGSATGMPGQICTMPDAAT